MKKAVAIMAVLLVALIALPMVNGCTRTATDEAPAKQTSELKGHLIVGGSAAGLPPIKLLTDAYAKKCPGVTFEYRPSSKTSAALKQVKSGVLDIGIAARELTPEEEALKLNHYQFLLDPIAIVVNKSEPVGALTSTQIRDVYSGTIKSWQSLGGTKSPIILCDRTEEETAKIALRRFILGSDLKIAERAIILEKESEMANAVSSTPQAIGYYSASLAFADPNVAVASVDGALPQVSNVRDGSYKTVRPVGIVTSDESRALKTFIKFAYSDEAKELLEKSGYLPLARSSN